MRRNIFLFCVLSEEISPGLCSYIISMDCNLAEWGIYGKFQNCSGIGTQGSCLESVTIVYKSNIIELQRGWAINYKGEKIDFFETQQHEVSRSFPEFSR